MKKNRKGSFLMKHCRPTLFRCNWTELRLFGSFLSFFTLIDIFISPQVSGEFWATLTTESYKMYETALVEVTKNQHFHGKGNLPWTTFNCTKKSVMMGKKLKQVGHELSVWLGRLIGLYYEYIFYVNILVLCAAADIMNMQETVTDN